MNLLDRARNLIGQDAAPQALAIAMQALRLNDAFETADARNGRSNHVKLSTLRSAMSPLPRADFDLALTFLRHRGILHVETHEGLHGTLTQADRDASIREAGSVLVYVSR